MTSLGYVDLAQHTSAPEAFPACQGDLGHQVRSLHAFGGQPTKLPLQLPVLS